MTTWMLLLAGAVVVLLLAVGLARHTELFVLSVERGRVRIVRGRLPQKLLGDIEDVVKKSRESGAIKVVVRDGAPRVSVSGELSTHIAQRLRNTISLWPVARIRTAPRPR
jgi:hypothetical protein